MRKPGPRTLILVLLATALVAAGCGGDDDDEDAATPAAPPAETAPGEADGAPAEAVPVDLDEFSFDPDDIEVESGTVIEANNVGSIGHNFTIEEGTDPTTQSEELAATPTFAAGNTEDLTVDLEPGEYSLVCTVPGHREAGMVGQITVR